MKKTFNININGASFIIDEDAFQLLNQYLETIKHAYSAGNDTAELLTDIEARIAELFTMKMPSPQTIITINMAEDVIRQIGNPCEFDDIDMQDTEDSGDVKPETSVPPRFDNPEPIHKQLYRDSRNKMVGGLCSGVSEYVGIDVTWVRIAVVALAFFSFSVVFIVYIILWAIVPEATTPIEFMKMRGEQPTMDNIGKTVTGVFNDGQRNPGSQPPDIPYSPRQSDGKRFADRFAAFCGAISRAVLLIVGVLAIPILIIMAFVAVAVLVSLLGFCFSGLSFILPEPVQQMEGGVTLCLTILCSLIVFGLPLSGLAYSILSNNKKSSHPTLRRSMLIVWVIALVFGTIGYFKCKHDHIYDELRNTTSTMSTVKYDNDGHGENVSLTIEEYSDEDSVTIVTAESPDTIATKQKTDNK